VVAVEGLARLKASASAPIASHAPQVDDLMAAVSHRQELTGAFFVSSTSTASGWLGAGSSTAGGRATSGWSFLVSFTRAVS